MTHRAHPHAGRITFAAAIMASTAMLVGCGPEAPPCNDAEVTRSMQELITQAHDDALKTPGFKVADLAAINLEAPEVTAYDDKLKTRSCKVAYTVRVPKDRPAQMARYVATMENPLINIMGGLGGLAAAFGGADPRKDLAQQQADVVAFQLWNEGPLGEGPVRKTASYRIQKEEGSNDYVVHTNIDVTGSIQYLRIAAQTDLLLKRSAQKNKAGSTKDAEPERPKPAGSEPEQIDEAKLQRAADMIAAGNPNRGADVPASGSSAGTAGKPSGPENLMSLVTRYEMCGEEALCLHTAKGNTVRMNAFGLSDGDRFLLEHNVKSHQPLCLRQLERVDAGEFTAESIGSEC